MHPGSEDDGNARMELRPALTFACMKLKKAEEGAPFSRLFRRISDHTDRRHPRLMQTREPGVSAV